MRARAHCSAAGLFIGLYYRKANAHSGVAPRCYHSWIATRYDRIPVTKDPALAAALDRVTPLVEAGKPAATLVHDLAIRGADALIEEGQDRAKQLAWVAEVTTSPHILWDPEVAARIDELAWGIPPDDA